MATINKYNTDIEVPRLIRDILRGVDEDNVSNGYTTYVLHPDGAADQRAWIMLEKKKKNQPSVSIIISAPEDVFFNPNQAQNSTEVDVDGACQIDIFVMGHQKPSGNKPRNRKIKQDVTTQILRTLDVNQSTFTDKFYSFSWSKKTVEGNDPLEYHDVITFNYGFA